MTEQDKKEMKEVMTDVLTVVLKKQNELTKKMINDAIEKAN